MKEAFQRYTIKDVSQYAYNRFSMMLRGFTPRGIKGRLYGPRVLANSVPKSGTNLLTECLSQFPMLRPTFKDVSITHNRVENSKELEKKIRKTGKGQYTPGHVFYSEENARILEKNNVITLLMIRDPRDVVTSHFNYVTRKNTFHRLHDYYNELENDHDRLMASIQGVSGKHSDDGQPLESIGEWMDSFLKWREKEYNLVVRFEELIGPQGGGDKDSQIETVEKISDHLNVNLSDDEVRYVADNTFSTGSSTFRKGLIGDWKNHFDPEHVSAFKEEAGEWLIELGYETNQDWSTD